MGNVKLLLGVALWLILVLAAAPGCTGRGSQLGSFAVGGQSADSTQAGQLMAGVLLGDLPKAASVHWPLRSLGADFLVELPHNLVSVSATSALFSPQWNGDGSQLDDLAFAIYQFDQGVQ